MLRPAIRERKDTNDRTYYSTHIFYQRVVSPGGGEHTVEGWEGRERKQLQGTATGACELETYRGNLFATTMPGGSGWDDSESDWLASDEEEDSGGGVGCSLRVDTGGGRRRNRVVGSDDEEDTPPLKSPNSGGGVASPKDHQKENLQASSPRGRRRSTLPSPFIGQNQVGWGEKAEAVPRLMQLQDQESSGQKERRIRQEMSDFRAGDERRAALEIQHGAPQADSLAPPLSWLGVKLSAKKPAASPLLLSLGQEEIFKEAREARRENTEISKKREEMAGLHPGALSTTKQMVESGNQARVSRTGDKVARALHIKNAVAEGTKKMLAEGPFDDDFDFAIFSRELSDAAGRDFDKVTGERMQAGDAAAAPEEEVDPIPEPGAVGEAIPEKVWDKLTLPPQTGKSKSTRLKSVSRINERWHELSNYWKEKLSDPLIITNTIMGKITVADLDAMVRGTCTIEQLQNKMVESRLEEQQRDRKGAREHL